MADVGASLKKKGPLGLPVYAWALLGLVVFWFLYKKYKGGSSQSTAVPSSTDTSGTDSGALTGSAGAGTAADNISGSDLAAVNSNLVSGLQAELSALNNLAAGDQALLAQWLANGGGTGSAGTGPYAPPPGPDPGPPPNPTPQPTPVPPPGSSPHTRPAPQPIRTLVIKTAGPTPPAHTTNRTLSFQGHGF